MDNVCSLFLYADVEAIKLANIPISADKVFVIALFIDALKGLLILKIEGSYAVPRKKIYKK